MSQASNPPAYVSRKTAIKLLEKVVTDRLGIPRTQRGIPLIAGPNLSYQPPAKICANGHCAYNDWGRRRYAQRKALERGIPGAAFTDVLYRSRQYWHIYPAPEHPVHAAVLFVHPESADGVVMAEVVRNATGDEAHLHMRWPLRRCEDCLPAQFRGQIERITLRIHWPGYGHLEWDREIAVSPGRRLWEVANRISWHYREFFEFIESQPGNPLMQHGGLPIGQCGFKFSDLRLWSIWTRADNGKNWVAEVSYAV
ncbi:hypothetical protein PLICRDRAFT_123364 [Plicaturopsis crispa FD-325 SS-3]|nr:hypothetical protein PLICRDRAFT_123364 [Plicaturopsis crispa FD-325 SS-3]